MSEKLLYSGIFNDEVCIQFLYMCESQIQETFKDLYSVCSKKVNTIETFGHCLKQVSEWGEPVFAEECLNFSSRFPESEDIFRSTFLSFVKQFFQRQGSPKMHIRLTVPPLSYFIRQLLLEASQHPYILSTQFFTSSSTLNKRDSSIEILRKCLKSCVHEYVIAQELHEADQNTKSNNPMPYVSEWDSASNIGAHKIIDDDEYDSHYAPSSYHQQTEKKYGQSSTSSRQKNTSLRLKQNNNESVTSQSRSRASRDVKPESQLEQQEKDNASEIKSLSDQSKSSGSRRSENNQERISGSKSSMSTISKHSKSTFQVRLMSEIAAKSQIS